MSTLLHSVEDERDHDLVVRYQSGDASAFAELYRLYYPRLVRYCRRQVRDEHTAEEVAQDAFLRAYQALPRFAGGSRFYPWLTVIARRLVIDHHRRTCRVQPAAEIDAGSATAAEEVVVARAESEHLLHALGRVHDRHQEVLRLRDWEGLSYEDIAQRLGATPTTVAPLLHRARAALRREYLAMSEAEQTAAVVPALAVLLAPLRRLRDRLMQAAAWLPEPATLAAPLAGTVLTLGALLPSTLGAGEPAARSGLSSPAAAPATAVTAVLQAPRPGVEHRASVEQQHGPHEGEAPPPTDVGVGRVQLHSDPDGVQRIREEGRDDPVHVDAGPVGHTMDPEEDRRVLEQRVSELFEGEQP